MLTDQPDKSFFITMQTGIKAFFCFALCLPCFGALGPSPTLSVSAKGIANGLSGIVNGGLQYGPDSTNGAGVITTTSGLQEAVNSLITNTNRTIPPAGGGIIQLQAGTYLCTSTLAISNRFANPITIVGVGDAPSTIIRLQPGSGNDGIKTTAPITTGNPSLNLRNLVLAYEGIYKQCVLNITDCQRLQCDNVYFTSWGFVTNGGLDGNVFSSYSTAHGASVVGVKIGTYDLSDGTFGLAIFNNCRFADLAAGVYTTIDHTWLNKCHFLLIGGQNKASPGTNNWVAGGAFTVPDSMYSLHPAVVNNSLNGDVRIDDPNIYYTYCLLLNARQGSFGHPIIRNTTAAGLEGAGWAVLQYDDINTGNAGQRVEIEAEPESALVSGISLVKKPGTISYRSPVGVSFAKNGTYGQNGTTNLTYLRGHGDGLVPGMDIGTVGGNNWLYGTNLADRLLSGIEWNRGTISLSGGTDSGINGTYFLSDRTFVEATAGGAVNTFSWTNAAYAVVLKGQINQSGNAGIYALGDSNLIHTLYDCNASFVLYPGFILNGAGSYSGNEGVGTPPTVTFNLVTNAAFFAGGIVAGPGGVLTGNGSGLTGVTPTITNFTSYAVGTPYTLTATPAQLTFGTTSPGVTLATTGTYLISATSGVKYNGATYAGAQTITFKLRRTNNTAADLTNGSRAVELPVLTTFTGGDVMSTPSVIYVAAAGDIVQLFGSVSATPAAGSVTTDSAEIIAIRLY